MLDLIEKQKETFIKYLNDYNIWSKTPEGEKYIKEHRDHQRFLQERLSKESLPNIKEKEISEIYKTLWASNIWHNKDWYVENKILKANRGIDYIKSELIKLFYSEELPLPKRYNEFKKNIKGLGSSALTELLHFVFPEKYCLWNDKPKTVLPFLELDSLFPEKVFKYQITDGEEYSLCNDIMDLLRKELISSGMIRADFIDLDCYIWFIFLKIIPKRKKGRPKGEEKGKKEEITRIKEEQIIIAIHEDAEYYLLKLGEMMGFITYTCDKKSKAKNTELGDMAIAKDLPPFAGERDLNSARTIDVIWFDEDENPKYCFEVEHTMDILRSLNRLYQLRQFHVDFVVVSPEDKRSKFDTEMGKSPFRSDKDRYHFISYNELISLYKNAEAFYGLKDKLFKE